MKIRFLFIVSVFFCSLKLAPAGAQNLNTGNVQSLNVDQINQAKTVLGYSGLSPKQAAAEARKRGASEAQIQQMLKRMEQEASEKKKGNELWLTDVAKEQIKDQIKLERSRRLDFSNASKKSEVKINMTEDHNWLHLKISSNFSTGAVVVEIIDPNGEKRGTYTIKTDDPVELGENTTTAEHVNAELAKDFRYPQNGEWIVRAIPTSATGWIVIEITQEYCQGLNR